LTHLDFHVFGKLIFPEMASGSRLWRCRQTEIALLGDFFLVGEICGSCKGPSRGCTLGGMGSKNGFGIRTYFYRQYLENLIVCFDKCLNNFENYVEEKRTDVQSYLCAFLVFTYFHSRNKIEILLSDFPRIK
jgi:hypothetical protein